MELRTFSLAMFSVRFSVINQEENPYQIPINKEFYYTPMTIDNGAN
jgi:hypothetical protein